jgi:ABC-type ATPase involved in cell division
MMNLIFRMNKRGMTVVIASHGSDYLLEGARIIRLEKGRIREVP